MRFLYIFPHPDDESFGPAPGIAKQLDQGHEVFLLTLTRGGATKQRHRLQLTVEAMGEVRLAEMRDVERVLSLTGMTVLDLPDSGLKEIDPRTIEKKVRDHILEVQPDILVSYPVHGISGFHDHLVTHAVVKRVFEELRESESSAPRRLAFFTIQEHASGQAKPGIHQLHCSTPEEIDCIVIPSKRHIELGLQALDCYVTYLDTIEATGIREKIKDPLCYELYRESFDQPLSDLTESIAG